MSALVGHGLAVDPPPGWDAHIYRRPAGPVGITMPVLHTANFALPPHRGDFGGGAVELMGPDHVMVMLVELGSDSVGTALCSSVGLPGPLAASAFRPTTLQRALPGQSGAQWFRTVGDRAFCLYVVLGSHARRHALVASVNQVLAGISVAPAPASAAAR